jgi:hypothetical protein
MIMLFDQIITEHFFLDCVRKPFIIDFGNAVAGIEDDVDELIAVIGLGEPVTERDLGAKPGT